MIRHSLLLMYRNFKRFRTTFFINLLGLSTGLSCATLIYLWVSDEMSVDKFHADGDRLYQVMTNQNRPDAIVTLPEGPGQLEAEMPAELPEIEYAVGASGVFDIMTLSAESKNINASGQFAGEHFFKIFSYPLLHGDRAQVLANKESIVLSEKMALALFNTTDDVVGKMVEWQVPGLESNVIVSGIFRQIPSNSSMQFDFVMPYQIYVDFMREYGSLSWGNHNALTYVRLKEHASLQEFNRKIEGFVRKREPKSNITLFAKPYAEKYLYGDYENGKVVGGRIVYVRLFSAIAVFIVIIACINFMNLATAKATRRVREVGIKKALGAGRRSLIFQYLGESLLMSFLSLALAILIVDLFLPQFNLITGKQLSLPVEVAPWLTLTAVATITGLIAGSYPALYLSGFNPARVLKGKFNIPGGEEWARKGLVIFQFSLAIIFIVCVWVVYAQMEYVQTKDLGYDKDNVIFLKPEGNIARSLDTFLDKAESLPGVSQASAMRGSVMGFTSFTTGAFEWKGRDPNVIVQFEHLGIYYDLIELLGIEMLEGRSFSRQHPSDSLGIIFNETAIRMMGLEDPVGETFKLWGTDYKIIGVTKDFHFQNLHEEVKPFFFRITPDDFNRIMVRLVEGEEQDALSQLASLYKGFNPGYVFSYEFLDAEFQAQYAAEQRVASLSKYFASLAILISCLGLFGLAAFTAERRLKEIGIRKVLGSTAGGIVVLLSGDFSRVVLLATAIAIPLSYLGVSRWLESFAYRIDLHWWYFAGAGLTALLIAWLTVAMQAWKAARINPVRCLRDE